MVDPLTKQWWHENVSEWYRVKQEAGVSPSEEVEFDLPRDPILPGEVCRSQEVIYWAARNGDWETAEAYASESPGALTAKVTMTGMTALHIAAAAGHTHFVLQLLKNLSPEDIAIGDNGGDTALHYAALEGKLDVAKILHHRNKELIASRGYNNNLPINTAVLGRPKDKTKELLMFLVRETREPFSGDDKDINLLARLTLLGFHDVTFSLVERRKEMAIAKTKDGKTILDFLVRLPGDFPSGTKLAFWEQWMYKLAPFGGNLREGRDDEEANHGRHEPGRNSKTWRTEGGECFRSISWSIIGTLVPIRCRKLLDVKRRHEAALKLLRFILEQTKELKKPDLSEFFTSGFVVKAARDGIIEVVIECLKLIPYESMGADKETKQVPIEAALIHRQNKVVVVIYKAQHRLTERPTPNSLWKKKRVTDFQPIIGGGLHAVAGLAPCRRLQSLTSPALQMQNEVQWFQEVEKRADPISRDLRNKFGKTAREVFTDEHKDLLEKAENWMKNMASYCMLAATLIATVAFAVAYTVPGGNYEDKGIPIFLRRKEFKGFLVSDAIALSSSINSLLMFLSIQTSRFAEEDFAKILPTKLVVGLAFLFISMASMILAFIFSLWIVVNDTAVWISFLATVSVAIPILVFLVLQIPIFVDMVVSTFGRGAVDLTVSDD